MTVRALTADAACEQRANALAKDYLAGRLSLREASARLRAQDPPPDAYCRAVDRDCCEEEE